MRYRDAMPYRPFEGQNCSIAAAAAVIGERWTLLVLREILLGRRRFAEIRRNTGIATNILADRLETLTDHGIVERREAGEGHEYAPTQLAIDANPVLVALMQWGDRYMAPHGAPRVLVHSACGHGADPALVCAHCHEPIDPRELRVRPGPGADEQQRSEPLLPAD